MSDFVEYFIGDVFDEFDRGEISVDEAEDLVCGIAWRSLQEPSLKDLKKRCADICLLYATRQLEAEAANGGLAQAVYNLELDWFRLAAEGYKSFGETVLSEHLSRLAENLPADAADRSGDLVALHYSLMKPGITDWFVEAEAKLVEKREHGVALRGDYLKAIRGALMKDLKGFAGKRMDPAVKKRMERRLAEYLNKQTAKE